MPIRDESRKHAGKTFKQRKMLSGHNNKKHTNYESGEVINAMFRLAPEWAAEDLAAAVRHHKPDGGWAFINYLYRADKLEEVRDGYRL